MDVESRRRRTNGVMCVCARTMGIVKKARCSTPPSHLPSSHAQSSQSQDVGISSLLLFHLLARGVVGEVVHKLNWGSLLPPVYVPTRRCL